MSRKRAPPKDEMLRILEDGIKRILADEGADPADVVKAIEAGTRLHLAKHKTRSDNDGENYFG